MSKYTKYQQVKPKPSGPHPIWRGIGCMILLILPVVSFGVAGLIIEGLKGKLPYWMSAPIYMSPLMYTYTPGLAKVGEVLFTHEYIVAQLILTLIIFIVAMGVLSFVYAVIYKAIGPSPYSPVDAPPTSHKIKHYKR